MIDNYQSGKYYVSSGLTIGLCRVSHLYEFLEKNNKVNIFIDSKLTNDVYKLKLEFSCSKDSDRNYPYNQSITELFNLIVHSDSSLSSLGINHLYSVNSISQVYMDFDLHMYNIQNKDKNEFLINNIRYDMAKSLHKKITSLHQILCK